MKLSEWAIQNIAPYVVGNGCTTQYHGGRDLVKIFNLYGDFKEIYDGALPINPKNGFRYSRIDYTEKRLNDMNNTVGLRNLLELILNESKEKNTVRNEMNLILNAEGYGVVENEGRFSIVGGIIENNTPIKNNAHFENIERQIIVALENAKISIYIVMAWFTNNNIANKLREKAKQGIDVQILIYDDSINRGKGADLSDLNVTWVKATRGGKMHDKFCVIDNQRVITGSYNWSSNAEHKNDENITILDDNERATAFSLEFRRIKSSKV